MSYTYAKRNQSEQAEKPEKAPQTAETAQSVAAARSSALADAHRVDLPDAMRSKMESAFGADFSAVKLYESQSVADAGAEAVTQGSSIAFAPGKLDLASAGGQSLLGHELSHVVSQARGEVTGSGFFNDHALEARADREGAMAAAGQQVYSGPVTGALSSAAPAISAAAPMQASRKNSRGETEEEEFSRLQDIKDNSEGAIAPGQGGTGGLSRKEQKRYDKLNKKRWKAMKKSMSNGDFYDMVDMSIEKPGGESSPTNVSVPRFAQDWYWKHHEKRSRWSGKKGWGTPEELQRRQAQQAEAKRREDEKYNAFKQSGIAAGGNPDDYEREEFFI